MTNEFVISDLKIETDPKDFSTFKQRFLFGAKPGYRDFRMLVPGDYEYQKAKIKVVLASQTTDQARIPSLNLLVDLPDILDRGSQAVAAVKTTINFNRAFTFPPEVKAQMKGGTVFGATRVSNITTTGFDVELLNASNGLIAGTISWSAQGC